MTTRTTRTTRTITRTVSDMIAAKEEPPLPLSVIPNFMGINLCSVDSVSWTEQEEDSQLVSLTIHFIPFNEAPRPRPTKAEVADLKWRLAAEAIRRGCRNCDKCKGAGCDACGHTGAVNASDGSPWTGGPITIPAR